MTTAPRQPSGNDKRCGSTPAPEAESGSQAERANREWIIAIRDNGIGFDPQYASKIFALF
jgi:light-regulated signal transduction histidine kinase (bacteriophytochrome)